MSPMRPKSVLEIEAADRELWVPLRQWLLCAPRAEYARA